ncbi:MAG: hypothetical protein NTV34_11940 [Proteobacteria bacterium]|nr:hypothetical protein [Pseudomonadota bacterium]
MKAESIQERRIRKVLYASVLAIVAMYISQPLFIHLRLRLLDASLVPMEFQGENCDRQNCHGIWKFVTSGKYLLLGHVMRNHRLIDGKTKQQVLPVSRVRGLEATSWSSLRVYSVEPGASYILEATKPRAVRMGYFIGILPRTTNQEGILSVPDISPTITTLTTMAGFGVLGALLFAAFLAPTSGANAQKRRDELITISVSALAAALVSAIGSGMIDSLLPDGELRSRVLRTAVLTTIMLLPFQTLFNSKVENLFTRLFIISASIVFTVNYNWPFFRAGDGWILSCSITIITISIYLLSRNYRIAGGCSLLVLYDSISMSGLYRIADIPPMYLLILLPITSFSLVVADIGGSSVIALASRAYQRLNRDLSIKKISLILEQPTNDTNSDISEAVKSILPIIAEITGAGRVSILVNLPLSRPITHSFTVADNKIVTHDDGKIPGAVTVRSFVYGDETWYERYSDFSKRLDIPSAKHLEQADFLCIAPIRVDQNNMGVLMLTCFDDTHISRLIKTGGIVEEKETGHLVVDTLAAAFSDIVLRNIKVNTSHASNLLLDIRDSIPVSNTLDDFFQRYCDAAYKITGLRTMLHQEINQLGMPICQSGFQKEHWSLFLESPFNLGPAAIRSYGSTVVAFREKKSSYPKDWTEIQDKLHSKSIEILMKIDAKTFLAVPLISGDSSFVVTMISGANDGPKDPGILNIIESTEAIFDAAVTVLNQRTSVLALGKLANRLIGDDEVREQIIQAAKQDYLPTTIGSARSSFLLLFDLAGSSDLAGDTESKAKSYGHFYDEVNRGVQTLLGGKIRKTIGDAVIATWDGSNTKLEDHKTLATSLIAVVASADQIARDIGCTGIRCVLHYGDYFFGLVGTASFGQIDVIGKGIDEVCKIEGKIKGVLFNNADIKICISSKASEKLLINKPADWIAVGLVPNTAVDNKSLVGISYIAGTECILSRKVKLAESNYLQIIEKSRAS